MSHKLKQAKGRHEQQNYYHNLAAHDEKEVEH